MIALLKEYADCFTWDYTKMLGLDRSIVEHRLPLKKGFRPFQQRAWQMKVEVLVEVRKRWKRCWKQDSSGPASMPSGFQVLYLCKRKMADGESV
jgi:hypothetical protein